MPAVPAAIPPLTITGRGASVRFATPVLLAPMEGITEAVFRELVIDLGGVGGACTEFIRVSSSAIPRKVIARHLGAQPAACPVGVQLMAPDADHIQATIEAAASAGAPWIDLNFGCPAPVVFDKCAGSALLAHPERVGAIIAAAVAATDVPVSAKIRAGVSDPSRLDDLVLAAIEAGAAMLTVHARLRTHAYTHPATWAWIARARELIDRSGRRVLLVGNGGVDHHDDVARLRRETGCDAVMVGRAALADPWIFARAAGGAAASADQAAGFAIAYGRALSERYGDRTALARLKQLVKYYRAGDLFTGRDDERQRLLRVQTLSELTAGFAARAAG